MCQQLRLVTVVVVLVLGLSTVPSVCQGKAPGTKVPMITGEDFRELVMDPTLPVMLAFISAKTRSAKKTFIPMYQEVADSLEGYAKLVLIDGDSRAGQGIAPMFQVTSFPSILLFNPELVAVPGGHEGQYMKNPLQFQGPQTAAGLTQFVFLATASHQLERLQDMQDTDEFLAKYTAHEMPKVFLFYQDNAVPPMYKAASHYHRYGAIFAVVNTTTPETEEIAERYDVKSFPTVVTVAGDDVARLADDPAGSVTVQGLHDFVGKVALGAEKKQQIAPLFIQEEIARQKKAEEEKKMNRATAPIVVATEQEWKEHCFERKKGYCIIAFVEDVNQVDLPMLEETAKKIAKRSPYRAQIVVVDGQANYDIAEHFQALNGFPEVVYLNPTKKGFHNHIGAFNPRSMTTFFADKATAMRGKKYDPSKVPRFQGSAGSSSGSTPDQEVAVDDDGSISDEL